MQDEIWVYVEERAGCIPPGAAETLGEGYALARARNVRLGAVLIEGRVPDILPELGRFGVQAVYLLDHPALDEYHPETYAAALDQAVRTCRPTLFLASSGQVTLDFFPRLAARLGAPILTGCIQVSDVGGTLEFVRPAYDGMASAVITCTAPPPILATLLPGTIGEPVPQPAETPEQVRISPNLEGVRARSRRISSTSGDPTRFDPAEADVIVAGGRGAGDPQDWLLLQRLAKSLGGALGGSRPALDSGHIQRGQMIGQTGKNVKTRLYLAAGISGSTYHLRGVNAEHLLAVNSDAQAPIFKSCQCGVHGDLRQILPELLKLSEDALSG